MTPAQVKVALIARWVRTQIVAIDAELSRPGIGHQRRAVLTAQREALWPLVELLIDLRPTVEAAKGDAA